MVTRATVLHTDNQGAIRLAVNPSTHQRTKHIDIRHHLIRELIHNKSIALEYVATGEQEADILTKPLPGPRHSSNLVQLGLREPRAWGGVLEVANTVLRLMPKYSIAMHGNAWHCSIAEDASGKDLCFHVVTVLYKSTTSCQARCTTEGEQPIIHNTWL